MNNIGFCGLDCGGCPAFLARLADDQALRVKTAAEWSGMYRAEIKPEDINCTGCTGTGIQFSWCREGCPIRKCALERKVWSCGACDDYPCGNLGFITDHCPDALERLEAVRISSKGPEHQV